METKKFILEGKEIELEVSTPEEDNIDYDLPAEIKEDLTNTSDLTSVVEEVQNA